MKNIIIIILLALVLVMSQDYFTKPSAFNNYKIGNVAEKRTSATKKIVSKISTQDNENLITINTFLTDNKFYDALAFYMKFDSPSNKQKIEKYLVKLAKTNPSLALDYMQIFLDEVPESKLWKVMISTRLLQGNYLEVISILKKEKEKALDEESVKKIDTKLKEVSIHYIDDLMQKNEYLPLMTFLEEMLANEEDSFYRFKLAKLYMKLDKAQEATELLEELQYDDIYEINAKIMLEKLANIDNVENENYEYAIPLEKYGAHYLVHVVLDDTSFKLILDTGASFIYIDEDKASMLEIVKENVLLKTAGEDVYATLCKADILRVGDLEISNIQVTTAPFKRENADGLLGMNFLNRFSFYIDQKKDILYLNPKSK